MKTLAERLNFAMSQKGISQNELARAVGMAQPSVWKLTSGKSETSKKIFEIAEVLEVSASWLQTGSGDIHDSIADKDSIPNEEEWQSVVAWDSKTPLDSEEVEVPFLKDIELACGDGSHDYGDYNGFKLRFSKATLRKFGAPTDGSTIFCFPAKGDSMDPVIPEGSTVTVNIADKQIVDGKIYAINQDGWKRLKLLYRTGPNKVSIRSYNQTYEPEEANLDEIEIIGRAVHFSVML